MDTREGLATRLRGIWVGVTDMDRSRAFYELLGTEFDASGSEGGILAGTLAGTRLIFEVANSHAGGRVPVFDVTDADILCSELRAAGCSIVAVPKDEPWGRQEPHGRSDARSARAHAAAQSAKVVGRTA